ncbi:hypothetical protein LBMAG18_09860 [Alphaproteobacteria bacterium]|nr:hypothetical protein LBMAG18_09860 [Alphaproteobacteria bacterium]
MHITQSQTLNIKEKTELLKRYVMCEKDLEWTEVRESIGISGDQTPNQGEFEQIMGTTSESLKLGNIPYQIFLAALRDNSDQSHTRFIEVITELMRIHPTTPVSYQQVLRSTLTNHIFRPTYHSNVEGGKASQRGVIVPQDDEFFGLDKPYTSLKESISSNKNLFLFKYLASRLVDEDKPKFVNGLIKTLSRDMNLEKKPGIKSISRSLESLIEIVKDISIDGDDNNKLDANFKELMGINAATYNKAKNVSNSNTYDFSRINLFFSKEILQSLPAKRSYEKILELLDLAGLEVEEKSKYIRSFVEKIFTQDATGIDKEKLSKLDYYIKRLFESTPDEIKSFKSQIVKGLYDGLQPYELDENFLDYVISKESHPKLEKDDIKILVFNLGIKRVKEILEERKNKEDCEIDQAISGDIKFLRKVLRKGDKDLLKELIEGKSPLINSVEIFNSVNSNTEDGKRFAPIRYFLLKEQDLSATNCLGLLFSKISEPNKQEILNDLIHQDTQNQQQSQAPEAIRPIAMNISDDFLLDLFSNKKYESARMLIALANNQQHSVNLSLNRLINTQRIFEHRNSDYIAFLNLIADNGPLNFKLMENGTEVIREFSRKSEIFQQILLKEQFYSSPSLPLVLLSQNNPASLALFIENIGPKDREQVLKKLTNYLQDKGNEGTKNSDACQNSLMFLLKKYPDLDQVFNGFLITNDLKKTDDQKLISAIYDSIFNQFKTQQTSLTGSAKDKLQQTPQAASAKDKLQQTPQAASAKDKLQQTPQAASAKDKLQQKPLHQKFEELNINPLLEAGAIFLHFDDDNVRKLKTNMNLGFGREANVKINKSSTTEIPDLLSGYIAGIAVGYDFSSRYPLLDSKEVDTISLRLTELLLQNGFSPIRRPLAPVTNPLIGAAATTIVNQGNTAGAAAGMG